MMWEYVWLGLGAVAATLTVLGVVLFAIGIVESARCVKLIKEIKVKLTSNSDNKSRSDKA
jgi:hypothetical protein